MLILTRKPNQSILIGKDNSIKITVLSVRGNQVQIGIDAPKEVAIHREEVFEKIQAKLAEANVNKVEELVIKKTDETEKAA